MTTEIDYEKVTIDILNDYIREFKKKEYIATIDSHLVNNLEIDSLDLIEIIIKITKYLSIPFDIENDIQNQPSTVKELVLLLKNHVASHK